MANLLVPCALVIAACLPPAATGAAQPSPPDPDSAARYCKALRVAAGPNFNELFGATRKHAYARCVSSTARKQAREDERQREAARAKAAEECRAEREDVGFPAAHGGESFEEFYGSLAGLNAYGRCVEKKAAEQTAAADEEDAAEQADRIDAARACKHARRSDPEQFRRNYGAHRSAFGRCVLRTAEELAEERVGEPVQEP